MRSGVRFLVIATTSLLFGALISCSDGETETEGGGPLTADESAYLVSANRILADANAAFNPIYFSLIDPSQRAEASSVVGSAQSLRELSDDLLQLEAPTRFAEQHLSLIHALSEMEGALTQASAALPASDEAALETVRVRADTAFQLLREASLAYLEAAR